MPVDVPKVLWHGHLVRLGKYHRQVTHCYVITVPSGLWYCHFDNNIVFNTSSRAPVLHEHTNHDPR